MLAGSVWPGWVPRPPVPVMPFATQEVATAIWAEITAACEAYFLRGETDWPGNRRAPEFTNEQVRLQFVHWNGYLKDGGALNWRGNATRTPYDFEALPTAIQRAVCERVWVICKDAKLDENPEYMQQVEAFRKVL